MTPTRSTPPASGPRRAPSSCTWSTSTARARAGRSTSTTCAGSRASWTCRCSTAAGCAPSWRPGTGWRAGRHAVVAARDALAAGADRIVLGTAAYTDVEFVESVLDAWGNRIVVAIDVREGYVSVSGWTERTQMPPDEVIRRLQGRGVKQFVYTNVDRDGMLAGPDLDEVQEVAGVIRGRFLYSGGIASLDDLRALKELRLVNLAGVISGKALYEGRFTVEEANDLLRERRHAA